MKDSLPNMNEVVRQMKFALANKENIINYEAIYDSLGLLIEEREQLIAENEQLKPRPVSCYPCLAAPDADDYVGMHMSNEPCIACINTLKAKVTEQDKEIQQFKTDAEYLQKVIDAKDEMLAWAERLVGSGPVPGIHYDPTNWLKEYRSTDYLERHIK